MCDKNNPAASGVVMTPAQATFVLNVLTLAKREVTERPPTTEEVRAADALRRRYSELKSGMSFGAAALQARVEFLCSLELKVELAEANDGSK